MTQRIYDPVGVGIAYPFRFDRGSLTLTAKTRIPITGDDGIGSDNVSTRKVLAATTNEQKEVMRQSIRRIIKTPTGTRMMEGGNGSLVNTMIFEVNDQIHRNLAASYAAFAVANQEQRAEILSARGTEPPSPEQLTGALDYRIRRTQVVDSVDFEGGMKP